MLHQTPLQICLLSKLSIFNFTGSGLKKRDGKRGPGDNYLRKAIFEIFPSKGGVYSRELVINRGTLINYLRKYGTCNLVPKQKKSRPQFKFVGNSDSVGKGSSLESFIV